MADKFELTDGEPAAPGGKANVKWQSDVNGNISAYVDLAGHVIQDEGVARTQRGALNFIGAGVAATDDLANNRTNVTITAASQTPWLSNIDAAGFDLTGAGRVIVGAPFTGSYKLAVAGTSRLEGAVDVMAALTIYGTGNLAGGGGNIIGFAQAGFSGDVTVGQLFSNSMVRSASGGFRFPDGTTQVTADKGQTPWTGNVDAAGFSLTGADLLYANNFLPRPRSASPGFAPDITSFGNNLFINSQGVAAADAYLSATRAVILRTGTELTERLRITDTLVQSQVLIESKSGGFRFPDGTTQVTAGQKQTPWAQDIAAAGFNLYNASNIQAVVSAISPVYAFTNVGPFAPGFDTRLEAYGNSLYVSATGVATASIIFRTGDTVERLRITDTLVQSQVLIESKSGGFKFPDSTVQTTADKGQTPWAQNIDAAGFELQNAGKITTAIEQDIVSGGNIVVRNSFGTIDANTSIRLDGSSNQMYLVCTTVAPKINFRLGAVDEVTVAPNSLSAIGQIESKSGGFRFPDSTVQTTADKGQTPWAGNVDAAGFSLTNITRIESIKVNVGNVSNNDVNPWSYALQFGTGAMSSNTGAFIGYRSDAVPLPGLTFTKDNYGPYSFRWCNHTTSGSPQGNGANLTQLMELTNSGGLLLFSLPTVGTGPSGTVWRDASAGNVLKIVP